MRAQLRHHGTERRLHQRLGGFFERLHAACKFTHITHITRATLRTRASAPQILQPFGIAPCRGNSLAAESADYVIVNLKRPLQPAGLLHRFHQRCHGMGARRQIQCVAQQVLRHGRRALHHAAQMQIHLGDKAAHGIVCRQPAMSDGIEHRAHDPPWRTVIAAALRRFDAAHGVPHLLQSRRIFGLAQPQEQPRFQPAARRAQRFRIHRNRRRVIARAGVQMRKKKIAVSDLLHAARAQQLAVSRQ